MGMNNLFGIISRYSLRPGLRTSLRTRVRSSAYSLQGNHNNCALCQSVSSIALHHPLLAWGLRSSQFCVRSEGLSSDSSQVYSLLLAVWCPHISSVLHRCRSFSHSIQSSRPPVSSLPAWRSLPIAFCASFTVSLSSCGGNIWQHIITYIYG